MPSRAFPPVEVKTMAETTDATPTWEPTEMSSAPQMITTVWTRASSPEMVTASPMTLMLAHVR